MAIHNWTKVPAWDWHDFHQAWITALRNALNSGLLPRPYVAQGDRKADLYVPDVATFESLSPRSGAEGGTATLARPEAGLFLESKADGTKRQRLVTIREAGDRRLVAAVEIVSPSNKATTSAVDDFVDKAVHFLRSGVHFVMIDLFPNTGRAPNGLHALIWERITFEDMDRSVSESLLAASYEAGRDDFRAYVNSFAVGGSLPRQPLFLRENFHVLLPLAETYEQTFSSTAFNVRDALS